MATNDIESNHECDDDIYITQGNVNNSDNNKDSSEMSGILSIIKDLQKEVKILKSKSELGCSKIDTSPNKRKILNVSSKGKTPVRDLNSTPVRVQEQQIEEEHAQAGGDDNLDVQYEEFNPHAELTDGFDSQDEMNQEAVLDFSKLSYINSDDELEKPINDKFAEIINKSWNSNKSFEAIKKLLDKYKCPENFSAQSPKVNAELWKLLSSWQKKSDVKFSMMQKSIKKSMNASITILNEFQKESIDVQNVAQIVTDISALLSRVFHKISLKRRVFVRNVINPEYKDLCAPSQPMTNKLFGDDLPKIIKELKLTNTIGNRHKIQSNSYQRYKPYNTKRGSFLGQGRGNPPRRGTWKRQYQKQNQQK